MKKFLINSECILFLTGKGIGQYAGDFQIEF